MSVAAFIASQTTEHHVPYAVACRALGVSQSWFYRWHDRPPTPRQDRRARLAGVVRKVFRKVFDDSGGPMAARVSASSYAQGWQVSDNTIAALMS